MKRDLKIAILTTVPVVLALVFAVPIGELFSAPHVFITDITQQNQPWVGNSVTLKVTIHNAGSKEAKNCLVNFDSGLNATNWRQSNTLYTIPSNSDGLTQIITDKYFVIGNYTLQAYVSCQNSLNSEIQPALISVTNP